MVYGGFRASVPGLANDHLMVPLDAA